MAVGLSFVFALGFALIHYFSKYMTFLKETPRSRFLSVAGGIAVAYVFLHLLPELNEYQNELTEHLESGAWAYLENHIFLVAMLGLVVFYGLERIVKISQKSKNSGEKQESSAGIFWLHIASFFLYNLIIGYLLIREQYDSLIGMFFYFLALGIHFVTNDRSLRTAHKETYDKYGRVLLTSAILVGWAIGAVAEVSELVISLLVAFIAGGIILNVMKEELPEERESSFGAFSLGLLFYTFLLMLL